MNLFTYNNIGLVGSSGDLLSESVVLSRQESVLVVHLFDSGDQLWQWLVSETCIFINNISAGMCAYYRRLT